MYSRLDFQGAQEQEDFQNVIKDAADKELVDSKVIESGSQIENTNENLQDIATGHEDTGTGVHYKADTDIDKEPVDLEVIENEN